MASAKDRVSIILTLGYVDQEINTSPHGALPGECRDPDAGDEIDHAGAIQSATAPWELVIVDRMWPRRWGRVAEVFGKDNENVRYIPPKPSEILDLGYRAVSTMRNAGAIMATGNLFAFVDDFCKLEGATVDMMWLFLQEENLLLTPVIFPSMADKDEVFGGHNGGVYACTRDHFIRLCGFDEHFDGAYGEEDTEFENRLDQLLYRYGAVIDGPKQRVHRPGAVFPRTRHHNGVFEQDTTPPWEMEGGDDEQQRTLKTYLRCNRALFMRVYDEMIRQGERIQANKPFEPGSPELDSLRFAPCVEGCGICNRPDREQQIESYVRFAPDQRIVQNMNVTLEKHSDRSGSFDPWGEPEFGYVGLANREEQ